MRAPRTIERKMGKCVPLNAVLGVQSGGGNKLVLFLRGQNVITDLEAEGPANVRVAEDDALDLLGRLSDSTRRCLGG